jgi:hypothetical protein
MCDFSVQNHHLSDVSGYIRMHPVDEELFVQPSTSGADSNLQNLFHGQNFDFFTSAESP